MYKLVIALIMFFLSAVSVGATPSTPTTASFSSTQIKLSADSKPIHVTSAHPEFTLTLTSNPTTGYSWYLRSYNSQLITLVGHKFVTSHRLLPGSGGKEVWTFKVNPNGFLAPQVSCIQLIYARPWEMKSGEIKKFTVITVPQSSNNKH